jgi:hypothetical protein
MKKIVLIALALITLQVSAQGERGQRQKMDKKQYAERMNDYTPEQMAQIQTKQMTLALDLTEAQQKQIMAINLENAKLKKSFMEERQKSMVNGETKEPTKEERFKMKNDMLDHKIEMKKKMSEILDKDQFEQWEAMVKEKMENGRRQKKQMMRKE